MTEIEFRDWRDAISAYEIDETLKAANSARTGALPFSRKGNDAFQEWAKKLKRSKKIALNLHKAIDSEKIKRSWNRLIGNGKRKTIINSSET